MDKYEFFPRPTTYKEIVGERNLVPVTKEDLVQKIEDLDRKNQAILVDFPIVPGGYGSYPFFEDWMNFLKRGREVNLQVPRNRSESIEQRLGPVKLRIDAVERMNPEEAYCGYVWSSQRSRSKNKVHLVDCIEGAKIFGFAKKSRDDRMKVRSYTDVWNVKDFGGIFEVKVPSRSREEPYTVVLRSVPLPRAPEQYSIWTDLNAAHGCNLSVHDAITFNRKTYEHTFCPHEIAAGIAVADNIYHKFKEKYGEGRFILLPFALPTQLTVDFYNKMKNNIMIVEEKIINKKLRKVKRPLNKAELEILLWKFVATKKDEKGRLHRPTLFTKTKLVNYNWD